MLISVPKISKNEIEGSRISITLSEMSVEINHPELVGSSTPEIRNLDGLNNPIS